MRRKQVQEIARHPGGTVALRQDGDARIGRGTLLKMGARRVRRRVIGDDKRDVHPRLSEHRVHLLIQPRPGLGHPVIGGHEDGDARTRHGAVFDHASQEISAPRRRTSPRRLP